MSIPALDKPVFIHLATVDAVAGWWSGTVVRKNKLSDFLIHSVLLEYILMALAGHKLGFTSKAGKKNSFSGFPIGLCFDGQAGMNSAPSGRYFRFGRRKLAKSAERRGLVRDNNRTVLIESSINGSFSLDNSMESSQVTIVLTFHVLEYRGVGGLRL